MLVVDMVEPLIPRFQPSLLQFNYILTKATPKSAIIVSANATFSTMFANLIFVLVVVVLTKVGLEDLSTKEDFRAHSDFALQIWVGTSPRFLLIVLRVLVPFPVIFAPKSFGT